MSQIIIFAQQSLFARRHIRIPGSGTIELRIRQGSNRLDVNHFHPPLAGGSGGRFHQVFLSIRAGDGTGYECFGFA